MPRPLKMHCSGFCNRGGRGGPGYAVEGSIRLSLTLLLAVSPAFSSSSQFEINLDPPIEVPYSTVREMQF